MANFDFNAFVQKASEVADKSVSLAKKAADKAVQAAKITKINTEIISEKENVKKSLQEIGKIYYNLNKANPAPEFAEAMAAVQKATNAIKAKRAEIEAIKAESKDDLSDICNEAPSDDDIEVEIVIGEDVAVDDSIAEADEAMEEDMESEEDIFEPDEVEETTVCEEGADCEDEDAEETEIAEDIFEDAEEPKTEE